MGDRASVALTPPAAVLKIVERLERAGHEAWCVGGAVRDALLGHLHLDWDITTAARPDQVRRLFKRSIPVGIEFGTVGVLDGDGVLHEVTTFRRDVRTDGRHAEVEFGVSLDDDLARRDFTINAMAYSPSRGELRDPFDGRGDLRRRIVRAVGEPGERMREDRLRALRALRFASRFEFTIDAGTWIAIKDSAPHLTRLSAERVKQEIEKTLQQVARPSVAFMMWRESGAFATLVPLLSDVSTHRFHVTDALPMPSLRTRPARKVLRLASLFLGDPVADVREALRQLRFSNQDVDSVTRLCDGWSAIGPDIASALEGERPADGRIRRWVAQVGRTQWTLVMRLGAAVWWAQRERGERAPSAAGVHSLYRRGVRIAFRDPVALADLAVDGDDVRAAGVAPGPAIGRTLSRLLDIVVEDPTQNQRDVLLAIVKRELR
ncbi:MAG TPA: CCA tRNA nucleotidyltransferase [Gemmatimonadaceae bacterium]|nr:CCA tRNA nucleotidyltransferase [Gemmatimonadaceae bacterium]